MIKTLSLLIALSLLCAISKTQVSQKYLIEAGKLYDATEGVFLKDMVILIDGKKIISVAEKRSVSEIERKNRTIINLSNYTVLPGLIDAHTHLLGREFVVPGMESFAGWNSIRSITKDGDAYRALLGSAKAKAYLEAGITTVQDLGNSGMYADLALRRAINEGLVPGSRMICSGPGLAAEGGQVMGLNFANSEIAGQEYRIVKGVEDGIQAVRENINMGVDLIKIYAENSPNRTALSIEEMSAIVREAHRYGVRVTAHATSNVAAYNAVISGVDGIDHGYQLADSTMKLMAQKGTILIPTDGDTASTKLYVRTAYPGDNRMAPLVKMRHLTLATRLSQAMKLGVTIAAGSDAYTDLGLPFAAKPKSTLIGYAEEGMSIPQILTAATVNAAKQVNRSKDLGKISKGYLADIIAVDNDLEKNIKAVLNVHFVMKDGTVFVGPKP